MFGWPWKFGAAKISPELTEVQLEEDKVTKFKATLDEKVSKLPLVGQITSCEVCGHDKLTYSFCQDPHHLDVVTGRGDILEKIRYRAGHLETTCARCKATWKERPLYTEEHDAQKEQPQQGDNTDPAG